jgi:hypothetical protein
MEMLPMTDPLRSLVMKHANSSELRDEAIREGMVTMYEDGLRKAVRGVTTFEEVVRVTRENRGSPMPVFRYKAVNPAEMSPSASSRPRTRQLSSACATRA